MKKKKKVESELIIIHSFIHWMMVMLGLET